MAMIVTKFSQGDTVYCAAAQVEKRRRPCPDCLGEKKWQATSPAGSEYAFDCPRCSAQYQSDRDLSLDYSEYAPLVHRRTIGSVQYNSAVGSYDHGARYMCVETGIGNGAVYEEDRLYASEDEALVAAKMLADAANQDTEWVVKQYNKSLKISDYQIGNALIENAKAVREACRSTLWNLGYLFERIEEADSKDDILEEVESYKSHDWQSDKDKFSQIAA